MTAESVGLVKRLSWIANVFFHQAIAVVLVYIWTIVFQNYKLDSYHTWHVVLSSFGIVLLMAEGLMLFAGNNVYVLYITRGQKVPIHALLLGLSAVSVTVGISLKIYHKSTFPEPEHFQSAHSLIGLFTWIFLFVSLVLGNMVKHANALQKCLRPIWFKLIHNLVGIFTFILGITTVCFGMYNDFFRLFTKESTVETAVIAISLLGLWVCSRPLMSLYSQIKGVVNK